MIQTTTTSQPQAVGHIHIDRIKVSGPLEHKPLGEPFYKGHPDYGYYSVASEAVGKAGKRKNDPNEFYVRSKAISDDGRANEVEFDCCPPKQLQGHNLFGHADVLDYSNACFERLTALNHLDVGESQCKEWQTGQVKLHWLHLTGNFLCLPHAKSAIINAIDQNNAKGKHRDWETCLTLGYTPTGRSQYQTATIYDKFGLLSLEWDKPDPLQQEILRLADGSLRIEIKLYSQWLRTYGIDESGKIANIAAELKKDPDAKFRVKSLAYVMNWTAVDVDALFFELLGGYNIRNSIQRLLTEDEERMLTKAERRGYLLWLNGENLHDHYSRTTVWNYIDSVKAKTGIDMKGSLRPDRLPVIDFAEMLTPANLVPIPDWAHGTSYYCPPATAREPVRLSPGRQPSNEAFALLHPCWA